MTAERGVTPEEIAGLIEHLKPPASDPLTYGNALRIEAAHGLAHQARVIEEKSTEISEQFSEIARLNGVVQRQYEQLSAMVADAERLRAALRQSREVLSISKGWAVQNRGRLGGALSKINAALDAIRGAISPPEEQGGEG